MKKRVPRPIPAEVTRAVTECLETRLPNINRFVVGVRAFGRPDSMVMAVADIKVGGRCLYVVFKYCGRKVTDWELCFIHSRRILVPTADIERLLGDLKPGQSYRKAEAELIARRIAEADEAMKRERKARGVKGKS